MTLLAETAIDVVCENRHKPWHVGQFALDVWSARWGGILEMVYAASQSTTVRPDHGERMT